MKSQKKLTLNWPNLRTALVLLILVSLIGPLFVDPLVTSGKVFYFVIAVVTGHLFPWLEVKDAESKDQKTDS